MELHDFLRLSELEKIPGKLFLNDFAFQKGLIIQFLKCHETTDFAIKNYVYNCKLIPVQNIYLLCETRLKQVQTLNAIRKYLCLAFNSNFLQSADLRQAMFGSDNVR